MSEKCLRKNRWRDCLYGEEVKQWRSSCIAANDGTRSINKSSSLEEQLKEEKKKSKELEKDLKRKGFSWNSSITSP